MKAMLISTATGLRGSTPADQDAWAKFKRKLETMKPGKWLRMEWSSPRNGPHHRKMFALLSKMTNPMAATGSASSVRRERGLVVTGWHRACSRPPVTRMP